MSNRDFLYLILIWPKFTVCTEMVKLVSCLVVLLAASVAPQRKFRLFNALFTDCGNFFKGIIA